MKAIGTGSRGIVAATFWFVGAATIISLLYPPTLGSDFQHMQLAWDNFIRSGQFNRLPILDPRNIARPASEFVTWWSPGAQVIVGITEWCGLSVGMSLSLWLGVTTALTALGLVKLYRELGFEERSVGLAVGLGIISYWGLYNFRQFQTADPFTNALTPWLFLWMMKLRGRPFGAAFVLFLVALLGSLTKLSFLITAASAASALIVDAFLDRTAGSRGLRPIIILGAALTGGLGLAWWALHANFLSRGASPLGGAAYHNTVGSFLFALSMAGMLPFSSLISFVSVSISLCTFFGWPHLDRNFPLVIATFLAAIVTYGCIYRTVPGRQYRDWVVGVLLCYFGAFFCLYFRHSVIGYDDRYFRALAFLLMPGVVVCASPGASRHVRAFAIAVLVLGAFWGVASYSFRIWECAKRGQTSCRGYSLLELPRRVETAVRDLDRRDAGKGALFCSTSEEAALAVCESRVVQLPEIENLPKLRGRTPHLLLILPPGSDCAAFQSHFADYDPTEWTLLRQDGWAICEAFGDKAPHLNH